LTKTIFDLERGELLASASHGRVAGAATYAYLAAQPNRGIIEDQHQISGSASLQVNSSWRVAGSVQYDLEQSHILVTARAFNMSATVWASV
jgi:LPS-assembly protein